MLGSIILPLGDFNATGHIANMYKHCKETEDKDMTVLDFITDHLINIDGIFDDHKNGDDQKPHKPIQSHQVVHVFQIVNKHNHFQPKPHFEYLSIIIHLGFYNSNYSFQTTTSIFHPPATV